MDEVTTPVETTEETPVVAAPEVEAAPAAETSEEAAA